MSQKFGWNPYDGWRKYQVQAGSLESFLEHYYKRDRYTGRGEDYAEAIRQSYRETLAHDGVCIISRHESRTGEVVAWYPDGTTAEEEQG